MSHIHTVVKVKADTPEQAIEIVNDLLTDNGEYKGYNSSASAFDYCSEEETKIAKTHVDLAEADERDFDENDFKESRKQELEEAEDYRKRAARERNINQKGYLLQRAGELLQDDRFWCYDRLVYDYTGWQNEEGRNTYYVETDRHY